MDFFIFKKVFKRLSTPISIFGCTPCGVISHGQICGVAFLLCSILPAALAQDIPSGFKVESLRTGMERNPFTLAKPTAQERQPSAFEKLFLASWLRDGSEEVVLVQNSNTNEVQRITATPNQNNVRLVEMHLNPNPQLMEAVISDGKEQGTVRFRFDAMPCLPQTKRPVTATGQGSSFQSPSQAPTMNIHHKVHIEGGAPKPAGKHLPPGSATTP
jgi:hypothetical protein